MNLETEYATDLKPCMQLKGGLFPLTTIQIFTNDLQLLEEQLNNKIEQAPNFFNNAPVVIDLCNLSKNDTNLDESISLDFVALKQILISKNLIPVGIKNANKDQQQCAILANLAILRSNSNFENYTKKPNYSSSYNNNEIINSNVTDTKKIEIKLPNNKLISTPVRSGQQVYAPDGDITIIGSVNNGAELLSDGSIHVYGSLRGRALAGINNNTKARIFCSSLEADLISIAGQFKISENIEPRFWKKSVQIFLSNGKLEITEFL